ncbi:MAG: CPBP family intramembrane glutamic endopeptidase [Bryobacteraceae bacterium]
MFFRGILQQMLGRVFRSDSAGLVVASLIFGASHLMYNDFPNWKFAILATAAGFVYGKTFQQAGSVRAAMVTHALVNTTWRVFLF